MSVSAFTSAEVFDVGDDDGAGVLGLPGAQLVGGDRVGQRAAGGGVGDQDRLLRRQDLGGLGHEVDAGEDDGARRRCAAAIRERASESPTWSATSWISGAW